VVQKHELRECSVLLAGATGGIGRALGKELQDRGAVVTSVARRIDALDGLEVSGARFAADLRSPEACTAAVAAAVAHADKLDVVINAVGVVSFGPVADLSVDAMEELFLTNTFLPIMLAQAALPLLEPGGAILNISGVIAEQNLPGMAAYGASKAATRAFGEAFAREGRQQKIRVIDARPPHTETGLVNRALEGQVPRMPTGLSPASVARTICEALEHGTTDLPSTAF
jgi:cyclic-di-GMP-binding biofilm dispersal mediator protein